MPSVKNALEAGFKVGLAGLLALAVAAPGWAQRGGRAAVPMRAPVTVPRSTPQPNNRVGTPLSPSFAPIHGVPGYGFDYQHVIAVGRPARGGVIHEPLRRGFVTPVIFGGVPYYYVGTDVPYDSPDDLPSYTEDTQPQYSPAQPTGPIVIQLQLPPAQPSSDRQAAPEEAQASDPGPDLDPLLLVRRDGQVLQAVAFTAIGDRLIYITSEGARRSFPLAELDKDATRQMNDANGATVSLPD